MRRAGVLSVGVLVAMLGASGIAHQQKPDLTGIWAATKDTPANLPMAPGAVMGGRFELRHKGNSLTVVRASRDASFENTFDIGGAEVRTRVRGALCMPDSLLIESAAWEGSALVFALTGTANLKVNVRRLFHQVDPNTLVVESTANIGGKPQQVGTVYKRTTEAMAPPVAPLAAKGTAATIADAGWVAGLWASEGASIVEERWTPPAGGTMHAVARTVRGPVLSAFEFLCIVEREGTLVYSAMPGGRSPATDFVLTQLTPDSLTFENPSHDFPKVIKYSKKGDAALETAVSGAPGSRVITATLVKK